MSVLVRVVRQFHEAADAGTLARVLARDGTLALWLRCVRCYMLALDAIRSGVTRVLPRSAGASQAPTGVSIRPGPGGGPRPGRDTILHPGRKKLASGQRSAHCFLPYRSAGSGRCQSG